MCCVRGPSSSTGRIAGEWIDGQPEPQHLFGATQPRAQFIQLQVREVQMAEEALVQGLCGSPARDRKARDGGLSKAEDPLSSRRVQPFGKGREHHGDLVRGSFQTIQRSVTPGSERGTTSLATKRLDPFGLAMFAISDKRVNVSIGDPEVPTLLVWTGEALGVDPLGCSPAAFHLTPGAYWRSRWPSARRGSGGKTTGGAIVWAAGLQETVECATLGSSS